MDQKFFIKKVIIDIVCSSWRPIDSLIDISFIMVLCGEYAFWATGELFTATL